MEQHSGHNVGQHGASRQRNNTLDDSVSQDGKAAVAIGIIALAIIVFVVVALV